MSAVKEWDFKTAIDPLVQTGINELVKADFIHRFEQRDASLWKEEPAHQSIIRNSLGWTTEPESMAAAIGPIRSFAAEMKKEGINAVVVLGMGGSSLCCEVFRNCFPQSPQGIRLEVLDSTSPNAVKDLEEKLDLKRSLFIVSSKSGSTMEPNCFMDYFFSRVEKVLGSKTADHFIAITDPGTSLEKKARQMRFRKIWPGDPMVGGRYSALTNFGIVPAAVSGINVEELLNRARAGRRLILSEKEPSHNPALVLGSFLGSHARNGKDKLTLILPPEFKAFGLWIQQLIAESTGKEGRGIVPIIAEEGLQAKDFGKDRIFVALTSEKDGPHKTLIANLKKEDRPVLHLDLEGPYDLGTQFFLCETATAAAGFLLGIDPFDQPNVQAAKDLTVKILSDAKEGKIAEEKNFSLAGEARVFSDEALRDSLQSENAKPNWPLNELLAKHFQRLKPGDYAVILAYTNPTQEAQDALEPLRTRLAKTFGVPVSLDFGPRYLHSTGQLYKGGGSNGLFLEIAVSSSTKLPIPGKPWGFETLFRAQSLGDYTALKNAGRRILRLDFSASDSAPLMTLARAGEKIKK